MAVNCQICARVIGLHRVRNGMVVCPRCADEIDNLDPKDQSAVSIEASFARLRALANALGATLHMDEKDDGKAHVGQ